MSSLAISQGDLLSIYPQRTEQDGGWWEERSSEWLRRIGQSGRGCQTRMNRFVERVNAQGSALAVLSKNALADEVAIVRRRLMRKDFADEPVARAFALTRELAGRYLGMRHHDVQIAVGWIMINGMIAEMETGEGKTLAATLPACAAALSGLPVHVVTVNSYLASRDVQSMMPLYEALGLTVAASTEGMTPAQRFRAYCCDVTYCTSKQLAFDYLYDRLELGRESTALAYQLAHLRPRTSNTLLLRGLYFAIVDEADSVLIDESRTPLIIAHRHEEPEKEALYRQALALAGKLVENVDYFISPPPRKIALTDSGRRQLTAWAKPLQGMWTGQRRRDYLVVQALTATHLFQRDQHYLIADGQVKIIDEYTGRIKADSSWEQGLHQMIECKEGCHLTGQNEPLARISFQRFFRRYLKLAGMTGTASEVKAELRSVYALESMSVPPRLPSQRRVLDARMYTTAAAKWRHVLGRVKELRAQGRPVLVGTRTVADSEQLSRLFLEEGLTHNLLNARQDAQEAELVAAAGKHSQITIATNMAGRGTDIKLEPAVAELGGLHVIIAESSDARRIDRQLAGRCARQGDPGSVETVISLDDRIIVDAYPGILIDFIKRCYSRPDQPMPCWMGKALLSLAQRSIELHHYRIRQLVFTQDRQLKRMLAFAGVSE